MENGLDKLISDLDSTGVEYSVDLPLAPRTSFHIGGNADLGVFPQNTDESVAVLRAAGAYGVRHMVLGNGSNVLFDDAGYRGAVIFTKKMRGINADGECITADAGAPLGAAAVAARDAGLSGLEFSYGIPGSVGGAICMNAGAYGGEMADVVASVTLYDRENGEVVTVDNAGMHFGYRKSIVGDRFVVLSASMRLPRGDKNMISEKMNELMRRRTEKQPLNYPSAGSVFKRSAPDVYVGKMIEESGLKGHTVGGAQVSLKHAGFIVNRGGATARDVNELIKYIQNKISEKYGIELECEIRRIPEWS